MVHRDHDAGAGDDVNAVAVSHGGDLSRPRATAVEDEAAFDAHVLAPALVVNDDGANALPLALNGGHAMVGQELGPVGLRGANRSPRHLPSIDRAVMDLEGSLDARIESWFAAQRLGDGDFCGWHLCSRCAGQELVRVFFIVVRRYHEEASGGLDRVGVDALDDLIFFGAFGGRLWIGCDVAAARVEQAVEATGGSLSDIRPVDEDG